MQEEKLFTIKHTIILCHVCKMYKKRIIIKECTAWRMENQISQLFGHIYKKNEKYAQPKELIY
jgi:hypothetical protein